MKSRWVSRIDKYPEQTSILNRQVSCTGKSPNQASLLAWQVSDETPKRWVSWMDEFSRHCVSWKDKFHWKAKISVIRVSWLGKSTGQTSLPDTKSPDRQVSGQMRHPDSRASKTIKVPGQKSFLDFTKLLYQTLPESSKLTFTSWVSLNFPMSI